MTGIRRYSDLVKLKTFEGRFEYLKLCGSVGFETFGFDRYLNQTFYQSYEWKKVRDLVIIRDNGSDLGLRDYPIFGKVYVHHMNPISPSDLVHSDEIIFDPEYLITVSHDTHNALHYGNFENIRGKDLIERKPYDTIPWKA